VRIANKTRVNREVAAILDRLGSSANVWGRRIQTLLGKGLLLDSFSRPIADG
jgi:hypothetical protein